MKLGTRRTVHWLLAIAASVLLTSVSSAQTNSYIATTDGFWDEARLWSLAAPPSITQSGIFITNAASVNVTIDSITATEFPDTLTISNLTIAPPSGNNSTLYLNNTGAVALHVLDAMQVGPGVFSGGSRGISSLVSTNSSLIVDGILGDQILDNGTILFAGGSFVATNVTLSIGDTDLNSSGYLFLSNTVAQLGSLSLGNHTGGNVQVNGGTVTLSGGLLVGNNSGFGSVLVANSALLVVTNAPTDIGVNSGAMTVSGAAFLATSVFLGGIRGFAQLSINNGTVTLSGDLGIGVSPEGAGSVSLNGGALIVTNGEIDIGSGDPSSDTSLSINGLFYARDIYVADTFDTSYASFSVGGGTSILTSNLFVGVGAEATASLSGGQLIATNAPILLSNNSTFTISGGELTAQEVDLGVALDRVGTLAMNDGSASVYGEINVGDCSKFASGLLSQTGGQLFVTNAAHNASINLQYGELDLEGGLLQVDTLVIPNTGTCATQFLHTGGTLIVGNVVLDPNAFQIVSATRQSNDVLVTWLMAPGATNALQASNGGVNGGYSTNSFTDLFVVTNNTTAGTLTNFLDLGAATNKARYYRARLSL